MSSNRSTIHGCCASEAAGFVHEPKHATDVVISEINVSVFICVRIEFDAKDSASRAQKQTKFAFCRGAACLSGMQSRKVVQAERKSKRSLRFCRGAACLSGGNPAKLCKPSAKANRVHFAEGSVCRLADDRGGQEVRKPYFSGFRFYILIVISNFAEPSGLIVWK